MAIITLNNNSLSSVTSLPAAISTGKVLQVVQGTELTSQTEITSSSYTDTGISATITPSSTSSKILIYLTCQANTRNSSGNGSYTETKLLRGSTDIYSTSNNGNYTYLFSVGGASSVDFWHLENTNYLDSPSTTSATTYKHQARNGSGNYYRVKSGHLTLIEVST